MSGPLAPEGPHGRVSLLAFRASSVYTYRLSVKMRDSSSVKGCWLSAGALNSSVFGATDAIHSWYVALGEMGMIRYPLVNAFE